jgi:hypothetical protein
MKRIPADNRNPRRQRVSSRRGTLEIGFRVERDRDNIPGETERDTWNGCHSPWLIPVHPMARAKQHPPPYFFFFFFSFFLGILVTRKKWWCKRYEGPLFSFFWGEGGGGGRETGLNPCGQITEGEKNLIYFFLNLLFPDVLLKFLTTKKISITKILKKEIKESTRIFFKYIYI